MTGIQAMRIGRERNGTLYATHCIMQYSKPDRAEEAIAKLRQRQTAFVRVEDAQAVLAAVAEMEAASADGG